MIKMKDQLDQFFQKYHQVDFIENDPILIPHLYNKKEDIEIMGFFASVLAWGQRISIINSCKKLSEIFDHSAHDFIMNHSDRDLKKCIGFVHRTFNDTDLLSIIGFLREEYLKHGSLEISFSSHITTKSENIEQALIGFRQLFEQSESFVHRSKKHISSPLSGSACKRLCMYLRWMVREDEKGIDFGLWKRIKPSQLICPMDIHVMNTVNEIGLMKCDKADWKNALELTRKLKTYSKTDPVKYDFALFGYGVNKKERLKLKHSF